MRAAAITLSVLSVIGGFAAAVALFVLGFVLTLGDNDKYGKLNLPGETQLVLPRDEVIVYYEERASLPSESRLSPPSGLRLRVRSAATKDQIQAESAGSRSSYTVNATSGISVARLRVPEEGLYIVDANVARPGAPDPAVTFGPDLDLAALAIRCLIAICAGLMLSLLFALLARALRRPPTPAPVPGPYSSAPVAAWQAPPRPPSADPQTALAQLDEDRRMGRIAEAEYQARRGQIFEGL